MLNRQSSGTVRGSATTILVFFLTFAFAEIGNPLFFCIKNSRYEKVRTVGDFGTWQVRIFSGGTRNDVGICDSLGSATTILVFYSDFCVRGNWQPTFLHKK